MFTNRPALLGAVAALVAAASALKIDFPSASNNGYWVACQNNTLSWTSNSSSDPQIFSVALLNGNQSDLNGNYQIANSLITANGTAQVWPNCVPPGQYTLLLVNASKYSLNKPEVYATSDTFTIQPNGTQKPTVSTTTSSSTDSAGNLNANGATTTSSGSSTNGTKSTTTTTSSNNNGTKNAAPGARAAVGEAQRLLATAASLGVVAVVVGGGLLI